MNKRGFVVRIKRFFRAFYLKIFRINDSPQKIAIGLGLGVFLGVMPGTGIVASLAVAFIFRVNRAAALLGSIFTNTWLSIPVFLLAVKIGSLVTGSGYDSIKSAWSTFLKEFHWAKLMEISVYKIIFPIMIGYLVVSVFIGGLAYFIALVLINRINKRKNEKKIL